MADNADVTPGSGAKVAADEVTYSGDTTKVQLVRLVDVAGAEGSKTLTGITDATLGVTVKPLGTVAHDAADSGNPVKVGLKATDSLDDATMVAAGDRTDWYSGLDGVALVKLYCPGADIIWERISNTNGTSTALSSFGATANVRNYITTIVAFNDSTSNGYVDIRDGTGGTVLLTLPLPAKGGTVFQPTVPLRQPTANTALAYDVSAALTTVYLSFGGYQSKT